MEKNSSFDLGSKVLIISRDKQLLRYLEWYGFPSKSLPPSFRAQHLVELHLRGSKLVKLVGVSCTNLYTTRNYSYHILVYLLFM